MDEPFSALKGVAVVVSVVSALIAAFGLYMIFDGVVAQPSNDNPFAPNLGPLQAIIGGAVTFSGLLGVLFGGGVHVLIAIETGVRDLKVTPPKPR